MRLYRILFCLFCTFSALANNAECQSDTLFGATPTPAPSTPPPPLRFSDFDPAVIPETYFSKELNNAKALIIADDLKKADKIIQDNIKSTTKRSPLQKAYILEGLAYRKQKKHKEEIQSYDNYLKLHAANSDVLFLKGQAQAMSGDLDTALNTLGESYWFGKYSFLTAADAHLQIALIYLHKQDKVRATDNLTKALAAKPDSVPVLIEQANLNMSEGKKPEAIANLRTALATNANHEAGKLLMAKTLLANASRDGSGKDIKEARDIAKTTLEKASNDKISEEAAALYVRASIEENDLEDAEKTLSTYLKKYPQSKELQVIDQQLKMEKKIQVENATPTPTTETEAG